MSKEFRGERTDNGEWVYGNRIVMNDGVWIVPQSYDCVAISKNSLHGLVEVVPETVGQSIGLHDKDGKDLDWWEGDRFILSSSEVVIKMQNGAFWFTDPKGNWTALCCNYTDAPERNQIRKIGTIHDLEVK